MHSIDRDAVSMAAPPLRIERKGLASVVSKSCSGRRVFCDTISLQKRVTCSVTGNLVRRGFWSEGPNSLENPVRRTIFLNLVLQKLWSGHGGIGLASKSD